MYSPKIKEDLIPVLYKLAKQDRKPMTKMVDEMLQAEITKRNRQVNQTKDVDAPTNVKKTADDEGS